MIIKRIFSSGNMIRREPSLIFPLNRQFSSLSHIHCRIFHVKYEDYRELSGACAVHWARAGESRGDSVCRMQVQA